MHAMNALQYKARKYTYLNKSGSRTELLITVSYFNDISVHSRVRDHRRPQEHVPAVRGDHVALADIED